MMGLDVLLFAGCQKAFRTQISHFLEEGVFPRKKKIFGKSALKTWKNFFLFVFLGTFVLTSGHLESLFAEFCVILHLCERPCRMKIFFLILQSL